MLTSKAVLAAIAALILPVAASAQTGRALETGKHPGCMMQQGMDQRMAPMQEHMKKMQEQMARIANATDARERERLMQEHMQSMHESCMGMMHDTGGAETGGHGTSGEHGH